MAKENPAADHPSTPQSGVPAELLDELHKANEKFHEARKHVDQANEALVNPFEERERAGQEIREAEKAVEEADKKIKHSM